jgi:hypothetical protein
MVSRIDLFSVIRFRLKRRNRRLASAESSATSAAISAATSSSSNKSWNVLFFKFKCVQYWLLRKLKFCSWIFITFAGMFKWL